MSKHALFLKEEIFADLFPNAGVIGNFMTIFPGDIFMNFHDPFALLSRNSVRNRPTDEEDLCSSHKKALAVLIGMKE